MALNGIHVLLCREQTTCILSVCVGFRASQMVWQCLCRQKKCDAEVSDYLAKSFHLMTRRTLNKQHGCVAATGIISRLLGLVYTCRPRPTVQSVLHVHFVDRPRPTLLHFSHWLFSCYCLGIRPTKILLPVHDYPWTCFCGA